MKPQFEISKNIVIIVLVSFICALGTYIILDKIIDSVKQETSQAENNDCDEVKTPLIEAINYLQDENEKLVLAKDSVQRQVSQLKKKVNFYFEFYRKNQPVGMEVESDTMSNPYGDIKLRSMIYHHPNQSGDMWIENGDTIVYFGENKYILNKGRLEIILDTL